MLAQDESRNISENIQWGFQRKFEKGDIFTKYKNFMGYDCVDGEIVVVPEQAEVARKIFDLYLHGLSLGQIKSFLESQGLKTVTGKDNWNAKTIRDMLRNEKYKGDTMLQKTFTDDFMAGKRSKNIGQRNRYYVKDSHPAIVPAEVFDKVQEEMAKRAKHVSKAYDLVETNGSKYNGKYMLGNLLMCRVCRAFYRRRTERGKGVWRCATRIEKGKELCPHSPTLDEGWLQNTLSKAICKNGVYKDYISLTDMVRNIENGLALIEKWLRNKNTIEFLGIWEEMYNPTFNSPEFEGIKNEAGLNRFVLSVKQWTEKTNSRGIIAKAGRYGGTYAHETIAFEFASWVSPQFKLYLIKEFQRLKEEEYKQLGWDIKRNLAKINYRIHTDAIKENLIPPQLTQQQVNQVYASEADVLNVALFGMSAKQWRDANPELKGSIRDYANVSQLVCLSNMENLNAVFIGEGMSQSERLKKLNTIAISQMKLLTEDRRIVALEEKS